ncbi:S8 family serine peptidase [Kribbella sp. NBC_01245]|uniref:S8 family peptidase n=1 Tax=Kribbella sp. NBC_01245 TaxID=2903578 RepID=UPI002E2E69BB|nr:S8 family serine peptidase [Kribbella sp. NBC_01245]
MFAPLRKPLAAIAAAALVTVTALAAPIPTASATGASGQQISAGLRAYFVITAPGATAAAGNAVKAGGGTVYAAYDAIGVIVAHSTAPDFATKVRAAQGVQKVGATRTSDIPAAAANPAIPAAPAQVPVSSPEVPRPDMTQIGADKAWAVNPGKPSITVAVLDTGVDDQHADLKANFDASRSASCAYGKADTRPGAWRPVQEHGTHVAGTIAAAKDGKGMVGVAPGVKVSSIRVAEPGTSLFFPENTVCAFMFAADKGVSVTNNSYYVDPWMFLCPDNQDQAAILEAVKRSTDYADRKGVVNVAAAGNEDTDLANKTSDSTSPNDSTPAARSITNDCLDLPAEIPGVVSVSAVGMLGTKAAFSNYGTGKIHVAAPGEGVYSTVPGGRYAANSGTSMAAPHVAGVAALVRSADPKLTPAQVRAKLASQANDLTCPASSGGECTGTPENNSYYGEGMVDAAEAVGAESVDPPTSGGGRLSITGPATQLGFTGLPVIPVQLKAISKVTYKAINLPTGLSLTPEGLISGVTSARPGEYAVLVSAKDASGRTGVKVIRWTVWGF